MGSYVSVVFALVFMLVESSRLCLSENASTTFCIEEERIALLKFKASFQDPNNVLSSWKGSDCCQWHGIGCNTNTRHVVMLDLRNPCGPFKPQSHVSSKCYMGQYELLAHEVNPSLLELKHLSYLDLSGNNFHGSPIPTFLGSMKQLTYLSLSHSCFSGSIPHNLGNLTNLLLLDLSFNNLHIHHGIHWISKLGSLQHLGMSYVDLGKAHTLFQVLNMLPSLLRIHLKYCGLDNLPIPLHPISLTNLARVQVFDLAGNALQASFLNAFQNMTSLRILDLSLNGPNSVPSWLAECSNLLELDMSANAMHGPIPDALRNLTSIKHLDLSSNSFVSPIPSWFYELKSLTYLNLANNEFTTMASGFVSSVLTNNCDLQTLELSFNKFKGEAFRGNGYVSNCNSYKLEELNLSDNDFTGRLPGWLGKFEKLRDLHLGSNSFVGTIPSSLGKLSNLRDLVLSSNSLVGPIPSSLGNLSNLKSLELSDNLLKGTIPDSFRELVNLISLVLNENNLDGILPSFIGQLLSLDRLSLSHNCLHGVLTDSIGQLVKLTWLDLSSNQFNGNIPTSLEMLVNLHSLDLSNNHFSGGIPEKIGDMKSLESIDISHNQLSGTIPNSMSKLTGLAYLSLSYNNFSGQIPRENQLLVLNDPFFYIGNPYLCGEPLQKKCPGEEIDKAPESNGDEDDDGRDDSEKIWFYLVVAVGFATGFWSVIGVLVFKKNWRHACFRSAEKVTDKIYVLIAIKVARIKKRMERNLVDE